jgi:hypothetical protein
MHLFSGNVGRVAADWKPRRFAGKEGTVDVPDSIQRAGTWPQSPEGDGQDAIAGPPDNPSAAARAARQLAADRYQTFASSGSTPGAATDPCEDFGAPDHDYDRCVRENVQNPVLFKWQGADADPIDSMDVQQGGLNDCHYLAPLAAMAATARGRAFIRGSVVENKNDAGDVVSWTVTLHHREKLPRLSPTFRDVRVTVREPFVVGHARARPGDGGPEVWPLVIEKACAQYAGGCNGIGRGGDPTEAMAVLTGREPTYTSFGWLARLFKSYGANDLQSDLANGKLVVLGTNAGIGGPLAPDSTPAQRQANADAHGLVGTHAYFATGVEQHDGRLFVRLGNPWGDTQPDLVPCDELTKWFSGVTVGSIP